MKYYVYQNWHRVRARVHLGTCSHCKNGQGTQPQDSGQNGKWHDPFDSKDAAITLMLSFRYADSDLCKVCRP